MMYTVNPDRMPMPDHWEDCQRYKGQKVKYPDARTLLVGESVYYPSSMFATTQDMRRLVIGFSTHARSSSKKFLNEYDGKGGVRIYRIA